MTSLSPYRPQRYADKTLPGQTSEDPLVQEALRVLSLYVSQSYDRYQEEVVRG